MNTLDYSFYFSEIIAAISGLIYIKYREVKALRYFVFFLFVTVFVETFGMLSMFFLEWEFLKPYWDSNFIKSNYWLYNIYYIFNYAVYALFFRENLIGKRALLFLKYLIIIYLISSFINLFFSGILFKSYSAYTVIFGTLLILLSVFIYFYEMLTSYEILKFYKNIVFYIAVGSAVFHLCTAPLFIFSRYFSEEANHDFVKVYNVILPIAIIFMYTCFTLGFILCLPQKKLYQKNKSY